MENNFKQINPEAIIMPDMILYKFLKSIFNIIKKDFQGQEDASKTILYSFFGKDEFGNDLEFETFNYFKQAKATFIVRDINVYIGYNLETAAMGCVHILLPSET